MNLSSTKKIPRVIDIPEGWGDTIEEFKNLVILSIKYAHLGAKAPKYDITNPDETITPFYPILCAVSPEWGVISKEEIYDILRPKFVERAMGAYLSSIKGYADHIWDTEYLAWGIEQQIFSPEQIKQIRFDHGETPESYIQQYGNPRLVEDIMNELIHPYSPFQAIKDKVSMDIDDCCCCH